MLVVSPPRQRAPFKTLSIAKPTRQGFEQHPQRSWRIGPYNTHHETDHRGDAHSPGSPGLIRFISPETVAGRGVEKRRIRNGVRHSRTDAKVFRGDRLDLLAWRSGPA